MRLAAADYIHADENEVQAIGEQLLIDEARRHDYVIVGPVDVKVIADSVTDDHVLHAEAEVITRRMPGQGRAQ